MGKQPGLLLPHNPTVIIFVYSERKKKMKQHKTKPMATKVATLNIARNQRYTVILVLALFLLLVGLVWAHEIVRAGGAKSVEGQRVVCNGYGPEVHVSGYVASKTAIIAEFSGKSVVIIRLSIVASTNEIAPVGEIILLELSQAIAVGLQRNDYIGLGCCIEYCNGWSFTNCRLVNPIVSIEDAQK